MKHFDIKYSGPLLGLLIIFAFISCSEADDPVSVDCSISNLTVEFTYTDPTSCSAKDGSIIPVVSGGNGPYQFNLDGQQFQSISRFENLGPGIYQMNVKDQSGCERSVSVLLKSPESNLSANLETTDSGCNLENGAIIIEPSGGVAPFAYRLNDGLATLTNAFFGLSSGNYKVDIIDNTGCSTTQTVQVSNGIRFGAIIKPIIETNCALTGCHLDQGNITFAVFANIQVRTADIIARIQSGNMPKNGPRLNQADIDAIVCWVNDGALEN
ncbi:hypothetical protein [Aquiflexum sp.]|uniref:hypothetical protein n=1 Tax=Aquiflexum sp. TaxID=1872584 RepID=UPI0035936BD0